MFVFLLLKTALAPGYGKSAACGCACAQDPFDSLRSLRVTGADAPHPSFVPNDTFPLGGRQGWGGYPRARRAGLSATLCRFINTRKRQNHAFAFFTLQRGAARRKSEFARRFIISVPLNAAQREKTGRRALRSIRERRVFSQITTIRSRRRGENCVN